VDLGPYRASDAPGGDSRCKASGGLDFYHASQYLSETIATCRHMPKAQRQALYKRLRHVLRHQADGVEVVMEELRTLATRQRGKAITRALRYYGGPYASHALCDPGGTQAPHRLWPGRECGARVINLRFKAPGPFGRNQQSVA